MAARIIAADPVKYPPDSLLGKWAALVLEQANADWRIETGPKAEAPRKSEEAA